MQFNFSKNSKKVDAKELTSSLDAKLVQLQQSATTFQPKVKKDDPPKKIEPVKMTTAEAADTDLITDALSSSNMKMSDQGK